MDNQVYKAPRVPKEPRVYRDLPDRGVSRGPGDHRVPPEPPENKYDSVGGIRRQGICTLLFILGFPRRYRTTWPSRINR